MPNLTTTPYPWAVLPAELESLSCFNQHGVRETKGTEGGCLGIT